MRWANNCFDHRRFPTPFFNGADIGNSTQAVQKREDIMQFGIGAVACESGNPNMVPEMAAQLLRAVIDN